MFLQTKAKGLRALLRECPTPEAVKEKDVEKLVRLLGCASRRKKQAFGKVMKIK